MTSEWTQDLRFGFRMLAKTPAMTLVIVMTLAVGIGFDGAIFSLLNTIVLNDLPIDEPERIVFVRSTNLPQGRDDVGVSYPDYRDFAAAARSFESLAAWQRISINLSDGAGVPERLIGSWVTPSMFDVLRLAPLRGRRLAPEDAEPGAEAVALVGYGMWQTRYGGDEGIVGGVIRVNGDPVTVVGVLPPVAEETPFAPDVWTPLVRTEERESRREDRSLVVIGRLAPGIARETAATELKQLAAQIEIEDPEANQGISAVALTSSQAITGDANRAISLILMGAVSVLLLMACANVANLLVSRALDRVREVSIRTALGASRWRVVRQMLIESLLLSMIGGVAAAGLAFWGARALAAAIMHAEPPPYWDFSVRPRVFVFVFLLSIGTSLLFGLAPALHATSSKVTDALRDGARGSSSSGTRRLTGALVVLQLILAVVLLANAGVMIRSTRNIQRVDWAVDPDNVLTMSLGLPPADYPERENIIAFHDELEERLVALPAVEAYALASSFPAEGGFSIVAEVEDLPLSDGHPVQMLQQMIVSPSYFDLARTGAVRGRLFTDADTFGSEPVIVVEQRLADLYWSGADPVGKRIRWVEEEEDRWLRVIGVVPSIKQVLPVGSADDDPVVYTPYRQEPLRGMGLMVRSSMDTEGLATLLRQEVQKLDAKLPLYDVAMLEQVIGQRVTGFRIASFLFVILGGVAVFLSCLGIYAVMAFAVGRRQQEIGIRVALGAQRRQVLSLVVRRALTQTILGLAIGIAGALATTRVLGMFMYEVSPNDPLTFALTLLLLLATALVACIVPARRASRVDPLVALRSE